MSKSSSSPSAARPTPDSGDSGPRPPQQDRSRRTLARIVEAGLALLDAGGPEAVTVQEVVARADTSVGSFYARFPGKEAFLHHLEDTVWREARDVWDREVGRRLSSDAPLEERIRALVTLLVETGGAPPPRRTSLGDADSPLAADFHAHVGSSVVGHLLAGAGRAAVRHEDPEAAVRLGYAAVAGVARERLEGWGDERLVSELTRLWLAYLGRPEDGGDESGGAVDYFEVWG